MAQTAVFTDPVVDRCTPPRQGMAGSLSLGKRQGPPHLMSIHPSSSAIESFDSGGVRAVVAHLIQSLFDARPTAMSFPHFNRFKLAALAMLDDLDMS